MNLQNLNNFSKHIDKTVDELLSWMEIIGEYDERFNLKIELNGKTLELDFHADLCNNLMSLVDKEKEDYLPITTEKFKKPNRYKALYELSNYFGGDLYIGDNGEVHVSFYNHGGFTCHIDCLDMDEVKAAIQEDKDQQKGEC